MTMAAQSVVRVDHFAPAREGLEAVFRKLTEAGASHHVDLGKMLKEGLSVVGALTFQGHLDALFEQEEQEVARWDRPEGSRVRVRERHLENEFGRMTVRRHRLTFAGEKEARFPMDQHLSLPPEIYALSLREQIAEAAVDASFDRSVERVDGATAGHVPKRQVERRLVTAAAIDFFCDVAGPTPSKP